MKLIKSIFLTLIFAFIGGSAIASGLGVPALPVIGCLTATSFIPTGAGSGVAYAGLYKEVWTGELIKRFTYDGSFLKGIPDYSRYVGNDVIHLIEAGVHPNVLINNVTYPLPVSPRPDLDIPVKLDRFDTEATYITKDEVYALSYDKIKLTHILHREALEMDSYNLAAYNFAPAAHTESTPVLQTTGDNNGFGFCRLIPIDLIILKKALDDRGIPKVGRRLLLCNQHVEDLLSLSETFKNQYNNISDGKVLKMFGFEIYEPGAMPLYDDTFNKKAYKSISAPTDRDASVAIYPKRMFKAKGSMGVDHTPRTATVKRDEISMDLRFIALPQNLEGFGAIVNGTSS